MTIASTEELIRRLNLMKDVAPTRAVADEAMATTDQTLRNQCLIHGSQISPFFVPTTLPGTIAQPQWLYMISQARIAAAKGVRGPRIMIAAPMKSGSTFLTRALALATGLPRVSLLMLLARAYDYTLYGAAMRPHEIDETALLAACLNPAGFVAHHHMVATPFLARQAELYGLKVVLIRRNVFDMLVSLDDFCLKEKKNANLDGEADYFSYGLPAAYGSMEFDDRIERLLDRYLQFYVNYYVSWAEVERRGLIAPLTISYETDILGDKVALATRIAGLSRGIDRARLSTELRRDKDMEHIHFNQGIAGRGSSITGVNRARVRRAFGDFGGPGDWDDLLGEG